MSRTIVKVKAFPDARKERVVQTDTHAYDMYVKEPAQHNLANNRYRMLVAEQYDVPIKTVRMQSGARSRSKTFVIEYSVTQVN